MQICFLFILRTGKLLKVSQVFLQIIGSRGKLKEREKEKKEERKKEGKKGGRKEGMKEKKEWVS